MAMGLTEILQLVGPLDDTPGENSARDRFRAHLAGSVKTVGALRDCIETCLRTSGTQYARALQDLVQGTKTVTPYDFKILVGKA